MPSSHSPDALVVAFDDDHAVAKAGLLLPATLAQRLGIEAVVDQLVDLGGRPGHHQPGRKVLTLLHALVAGGDCIDDADVLRTGSTTAVLGHRVMAPPRWGRSCAASPSGTSASSTAWPRLSWAGRGPPVPALAMAHDPRPGLHHLRGSRPPPGRCRLRLHPPARLPPAAGHPGRHRRGAACPPAHRAGRLGPRRGAVRQRARGTGAPRRRQRPVDAAGRLGLVVGQGAGRLPPPPHPLLGHRPPDSTVTQAIASIPEQAWSDIGYPDGGQAQVAETTLGPDRLVVRRTRLVGPQATLWPDWRYHAFVTDRAGSPIELDADHRRHAVCELAICDLKDGAGLRHCPSGRFLANAAWLVITALAHNLLRWVAALGLGASGHVVAKTLRRRLLTLPGRLTRSARRRRLHLPTDWPWADQFLDALARLRVIPYLPERPSTRHPARPRQGDAMPPRRPLTGVITIEWVDAGDPDDIAQPPNFGWFSLRTEPQLEDRRLVLLLREVADSVENDPHTNPPLPEH